MQGRLLRILDAGMTGLVCWPTSPEILRGKCLFQWIWNSTSLEEICQDCWAARGKSSEREPVPPGCVRHILRRGGCSLECRFR